MENHSTPSRWPVTSIADFGQDDGRAMRLRDKGAAKEGRDPMEQTSSDPADVVARVRRIQLQLWRDLREFYLSKFRPRLSTDRQVCSHALAAWQQ